MNLTTMFTTSYSLARKLILYILLFSSIVTVIITAIQLYFDYYRDVRLIDKNMQQIRSSHLGTVINSIWVSNINHLRIELEGIMRLPDMQYLELQIDDDIISLGTNKNKRIIKYEYPLFYTYRDKDVYLGRLTAVASLEGVFQRLIDKALIILMTNAVKTFLVSAFIFFLFYYLVGRHLSRMAYYSEKLDLDHLDKHLTLNRAGQASNNADELEVLVSSINSMRNNLQRDIEEKRKVEDQLRVNEKLLKKSQEIAHLGSWHLDIKKNILTWSDEEFRIFGRTPQEFGATYEAFLETIHPDDREMVNATYTKAIENNLPYECIHRVVRPDGVERIVIEKSEDVVDDNGQTIHSFGFTQDITEQKTGSDKLAWELQVNKTLAELGRELVAPGNSIKYISAKVLEGALCLTGSEHGYVSEIDRVTHENVGHTLTSMMGEACKINREDQRIAFPCGKDGNYPKLWGVSLNTGKSFFSNSPEAHQCFTELPEGHISLKCFLSVPVKYGGEVVGQIALANSQGGYSNIHIEAIERLGDLYALAINRHRVSEDNLQMENRLQQAHKMEAIGTLAGGIAHDFNNILGAILGYADMAKEDAPPGTKLDRDLEKILIGANRAKDLVKQILAFSRQVKVKRMPMKIQPLVKEGLKMLRSSIPTTISISEDIDPRGGVVLADPTQIHQILMNLCTNAYQSMEIVGGELFVSVKSKVISSSQQNNIGIQQGDYVELAVSDTGAGIGPETIGKIFDPYFTTKETGKGTGMGLSIIHGIVKEYGGTITVESQLSKGSTFYVYLPLVDKETIQDIKGSENIPKGKERILFIDDEKILAEMGRDMLERLGYHVTVRQSSIEALTTFQNTPNEYDIVITDQTMPDMTGIDLARRMMQIRPNIPIILCTGYSNLVDENSAKAIGIKEFTLKPLTKRMIAELIRKVLDT